MHIGGALNNLPEGHSAVGNRDAQFVLTFLGSWEKADDDGQNIGWARMMPGTILNRFQPEITISISRQKMRDRTESMLPWAMDSKGLPQ